MVLMQEIQRYRKKRRRKALLLKKTVKRTPDLQIKHTSTNKFQEVWASQNTQSAEREVMCTIFLFQLSDFHNQYFLNIMFYALMGRFQLELIYYFTYFSTVVPSNSCVFLSCRPFEVNMTFSTGLVDVQVSNCLLAWAVDSWSLNH